jgi:hypothetical protein
VKNKVILALKGFAGILKKKTQRTVGFSQGTPDGQKVEPDLWKIWSFCIDWILLFWIKSPAKWQILRGI